MHRHAEGCGDLWSKQTISSSNNSSIQSSNNINNLVNQQPTTVALPSTSTSLSSTSTSTVVAAASVVGMTAGQNIPLKPKSTNREWVVIPIFSDIVRLALTTRKDCSTM